MRLCGVGILLATFVCGCFRQAWFASPLTRAASRAPSAVAPYDTGPARATATVTPQGEPFIVTLSPDPTVTAGFTPSPLFMLVPHDLLERVGPVAARHGYTAIVDWLDTASLEGGAPAARLVRSRSAPLGATLVHSEPYVAVTHLLLPTLGVTTEDLARWARGEAPGLTLVVGDEGEAVLELLNLESLAPGTVRVDGWETAREYVATHPDTWALVPWDALNARVQVIPVDGLWPNPRRPETLGLQRRLWLVAKRVPPAGIVDGLSAALGRPFPCAELVAVGDIMLSRLVGERMEAWGALYPFEGEGIIPAISGADLAFGNLECPISHRGVIQNKGYHFRAASYAARALADAGFDVLSLANNHTGDYGDLALSDTLHALSEVGIAAVGAGETITNAHAAVVSAVGDLRVAFLAYNEIGPGFFAATETSPGSAFVDLERMRADIAAARREADVVVVSCHWGTEYEAAPSLDQRQLAEDLASAGASLVIGHHPHVVQSLGFLGRTMVAFSLGNFVFDQGLSPQTEEGLVMRALVDVSGVKYVRWDRSVSFRSQPAIVSAEEALPMLQRLLSVTAAQGLLPR